MATLTAYASGYANAGTATWANQSNAYGSTTGNYCTWTSTTRNASTTIDFNGFGTWSGIPAGSTINSVTVSIKGYVNSTTYISALTARAFIGTTGKGSGATTLTRTTTTTNVYADIVYTDISLAELQGDTLEITVTATHNNSTNSGVAYWDYFAVTVDYTAPAAETNADAQSAEVTCATVDAGTSAAPTVEAAAASTATADATATGVPAGDYELVCVFSDPQADTGGGTNTRIADNMDLIRAQSYDYVLGGGDFCNNWTAQEISDFDTRLGSTLKTATHPAMGNHEHDYAWPDGYDYWGTAAGPNSSTTWYSFDTAGGWHIIVCDAGGSGPSITSGSTQYNWLSADLDANTDKPTIVMWHWGRYSGCSAHGNNTSTSDAFALLLTHSQVEAVISGHQHMYERFARMNNAGAVDSTNGIRQFTMPPCGQTTTYTNSSPTGLEFYANSTYTGIFRLYLYADHYEWDVVVPSGYNAITDTGSQTVRVPTSADRNAYPEAAQVSTADASATVDIETPGQAQAGCATVASADGNAIGYGEAAGGGGGSPSLRAVPASFSSTTTNWVLNKPTGTASGDLLLAAICLNGLAASAITPPNGWTAVFESTPNAEPSTTYQSLHVFSRVADGTEGSTFTFTSGTSVAGSGNCIAIQNASSTLDGANANESTSATTSPTVSFTTTDTDLLISFLAEDSGSTVITIPSGWSNLWNDTSSQKSAGAYLASQAAGSKTATWSLAAAKAYSAWGTGIKGTGGAPSHSAFAEPAMVTGIQDLTPDITTGGATTEAQAQSADAATADATAGASKSAQPTPEAATASTATADAGSSASPTVQAAMATTATADAGSSASPTVQSADVVTADVTSSASKNAQPILEVAQVGTGTADVTSQTASQTNAQAQSADVGTASVDAGISASPTVESAQATTATADATWTESSQPTPEVAAVTTAGADVTSQTAAYTNAPAQSAEVASSSADASWTEAAFAQVEAAAVGTGSVDPTPGVGAAAQSSSVSTATADPGTSTSPSIEAAAVTTAGADVTSQTAAYTNASAQSAEVASSSADASWTEAALAQVEAAAVGTGSVDAGADKNAQPVAQAATASTSTTDAGSSASPTVQVSGVSAEPADVTAQTTGATNAQAQVATVTCEPADVGAVTDHQAAAASADVAVGPANATAQISAYPPVDVAVVSTEPADPSPSVGPTAGYAQAGVAMVDATAQIGRMVDAVFADAMATAWDTIARTAVLVGAGVAAVSGSAQDATAEKVAGVTYRPYAGLTSPGDDGHIDRPDTGTTVRPIGGAV